MGFELITLVMICTNCTGSCKSNYHTITATTAPAQKQDNVFSWASCCFSELTL